MHWKIGSVYFEITFGFFAAIAVFLLFDRSGLLLWSLLCILLHEMGHLIVMLLFGCHLYRIVLEPFGIKIEERSVCRSFIKEAVVLFAGPAANLLLFFILYAIYGRNLPIVGIISLLMGVLNLLPIGLMDGGRMLENLFSAILPYQKVRLICDVVSILFWVPLFVLSILMACHANHNFTLLLLCIYLFVTIWFKIELQSL